MRSKLRTFLTILPAALLVSAACWGQTTAISGQVKGTDGQPLKGALIKIQRTDIKGNYKVKTDKKGHYYYGGLGLGVYNVTVEVDGKDVDAMNGVRTTNGQSQEVNFDLKQAQARAAAGAEPEPEEPERGMTAAQKAEYEKNKKAKEEALAHDKALNDAFNAGRVAEEAKNWDVAVQQFEKASQIDPKQHVVWSHLADSYINLAGTKTGAERDADLQKGVADYQKAVEIQPDNPAYHNNYGLALAKMKKMDEAQAELTKAAQLDPTQAGKYYYNLGAVYVNISQPDAATAAFKKAIEVDPNYADAYYQMGIVMLGKATTSSDGKIVPPEGTVEEFQKYLSLAPTGSFAESAKQMLATLGAPIQTSFEKSGKKKK
jgi:tetratricopeptide (TPR) repeat protein